MRRYLSLKTKDDFEIIQQEHRELLRAYRSEEALCDAINALTNGFSCNHGWACVGHGRFENLKEFCSGLATFFPGTATVESGFSIVNYKKNEYRTTLTDLTLEGILHSKQYKMIEGFKHCS